MKIALFLNLTKMIKVKEFSTIYDNMTDRQLQQLFFVKKVLAEKGISENPLKKEEANKIFNILIERKKNGK